MSINNNNNFQWRENDNSMQTRLRYDLEAGHWMEAFQRNFMRRQSSSQGLNFIYGLFLIFSGLIGVALFISYVILSLLYRLIVYGIVKYRENRDSRKEKSFQN